jgi:hypothetical protein
MLVLSGCVPNPAPDSAPSPRTSSLSPSPATSSPAESGDPPAPIDDATVTPAPEAAASSQTGALTAAVAAVTAFGRPDLTYAEWIDGLYPLMTQAGASAYEGTDPANVPVHQVTGDGVILPGSTDVALIVEVPTDAGLYNVSLSRPSTTSPWLADRIRPAGS